MQTNIKLCGKYVVIEIHILLLPIDKN